MVPRSSPNKLLFTQKKVPSYGNMSCPRHIGEGQEIQEHQGTWKKLKLEPKLGFEILHHLSSTNWRLGFSRSEFVKVGFFFVGKLACFSGRNEHCPYKNWLPFSLNFAFQNINSRGIVRRSQFNHSKEAKQLRVFIEFGCSVSQELCP